MDRTQFGVVPISGPHSLWLERGSKVARLRYRRYFKTHPFRNGRIEEVLPLILWYLRRLFFEGFCNRADAVVGVVEDLAGFNRMRALKEELVGNSR